jgi:hypothetical protein
VLKTVPIVGYVLNVNQGTLTLSLHEVNITPFHNAGFCAFNALQLKLALIPEICGIHCGLFTGDVALTKYRDLESILIVPA